jgi:hypothetical protein
MHAVQPGQRVPILTIQIAVAAAADPDSVAEKLSELLSENGICSDDSHILDMALPDRIPASRHSR